MTEETKPEETSVNFKELFENSALLKDGDGQPLQQQRRWKKKWNGPTMKSARKRKSWYVAKGLGITYTKKHPRRQTEEK